MSWSGVRKWTCGALVASAFALGGAIIAPSQADAFCGFFVSTGDEDLFNDATQVVLMREGTQTILSMQNNYKGPIKNFAMVVPVPEILMQDDVKTLPKDVFDKLDTYSAPRLVEYNEASPCPNYDGWCDWYGNNAQAGGNNAFDDSDPSSPPNEEPGGVVVEAQFEVGEYEVVILSATEANSLESWLATNNYSIPMGAAPIFQQYIQQGMYFFVAKVDPAKVTFKEGQAVLSPLRFAYDSPEFSLPVRLGMVNSAGDQDLIVYTLSRQTRYEVANKPNVAIPTNILVQSGVKQGFGQFYRGLFAETLANNPGAVITEYAWEADYSLANKWAQCDPCPPDGLLDGSDLLSLGVDVLDPQRSQGVLSSNWVFTRLHARYGTDGASEDLVFQSAPNLYGGLGTPSGADGAIDRTPILGGGDQNRFQGRYIILNPWEGDVTCANPEYGNWGQSWGPPGVVQSPNTAGQMSMEMAPGDLPSAVMIDVPELGVTASEKFADRALDPGDPDGPTGPPDCEDAYNNQSSNSHSANNNAHSGNSDSPGSAGNNSAGNNSSDGGSNQPGAGQSGAGDDEEGGGCSTAGGGSAPWLAGLIGFALMGLRRRRR